MDAEKPLDQPQFKECQLKDGSRLVKVGTSWLYHDHSNGAFTMLTDVGIQISAEACLDGLSDSFELPWPAGETIQVLRDNVQVESDNVMKLPKFTFRKK